MTKTQYKFVHLTSYLTIVHGCIYYVFIEFMKIETEYGLRPHSFQSTFQALHILLSPLLLFSFGILWKDHVLKFFKKRTRKLVSGSLLTISLFSIGLSGYLIQIIYTPDPKKIAIWGHLAFSFIYILAYVVHHVKSYKK